VRLPRVQEFSSAGGFIVAFGSAGSGNGQFSGPRGVAFSASGTLYVADTGNNRVQEWMPSP
jgi:DNA-binding beta-propeller fold protein YncE